MASAACRRYWSRLVADGCLLCGSPAQIAHCHGGSITERTQQPKAKGKKLAYMDWLVLPLCPFHHALLDAGVHAFEAMYSDQAYMIDLLAERFNMPLWALARSKKLTITGGKP